MTLPRADSTGAARSAVKFVFGSAAVVILALAVCIGWLFF